MRSNIPCDGSSSRPISVTRLATSDTGLLDDTVPEELPMTDGDPGDARGTAHRLLKFAESGLADFAAHVAPGLRLPGSYAGHEIGDDTRADLLYVQAC